MGLRHISKLPGGSWLAAKPSGVADGGCSCRQQVGRRICRWARDQRAAAEQCRSDRLSEPDTAWGRYGAGIDQHETKDRSDGLRRDGGMGVGHVSAMSVRGSGDG